MRINNNLAAQNAWRNLTVSGNNMTKSLERLSSGYRINRAADDAAGLAVSEKMKAQIRGLSMAERNTQDGISLLQTAEGGASKIQDMLQRMRELAVQSASGSLEDNDRAQLQAEFEELTKEINRTASTITFNNQSLINGTPEVKDASGTVTTEAKLDGKTTFTIQVGANEGESINFELTSLNTVGLGLADTTATDPDTLKTGITIANGSDAAKTITALDTALKTVSTARAQMGAYQNRLESTVSTLQTQNENLTAAESRIRDVDMAQEMANFTKYQVLQQAGTAMLAQANQLPQSILSLLQ